MAHAERKRKHGHPATDHHHYPPYAPAPPSPPSSTFASRGGGRHTSHNGYVEYTYGHGHGHNPAAPQPARTTRRRSHHSNPHHRPQPYSESENSHHDTQGRPGKRHKTRTHEDPPEDGNLSDTGADVGEVSFDAAGDELSQKFATLNEALADVLALITDKPERSYPLLHRVLGRERSSFLKTMKVMQMDGTLSWLVHPRGPPPKKENKDISPDVRHTSCGLTLTKVTPDMIEAMEREEKTRSRKVSAAASVRSDVTSSTVPPVPFASSTDPGVKRAKIWPPELPEIPNEDIRRQVFTHKSIVDGATSLIGSETVHNERLEFLGDSYLGAIVTRHIFSRFPSLREGAMTSIRSNIVGNKNLHEYGLMYKFDKKLIAGENKHAELLSRPKTVADMFEAYIGGLLLDRGSEVVDEWLKDLIEPKMKQLSEEYSKEKPLNKAAKNEINNLVGGKSVKIDYKWTDGGGGNQGGYYFTIVFTGWGITEKVLGTGWGPNKTDASIRAAMNALEERHALREVKRAKERWYEEQAAAASETGTVIRHDIED